jgi:hypothetical protein
MNQLEGLLILIALPLGLLLNGYWIAAALKDETPLARLAVALPAGLFAILALVAAVNFFRPLAGVWAYACLAPALVTLAWPRLVRALGQDAAAAWRARDNLVLGAGALFFLCLLWPVLQNPATIFYDGTSNHDSFFWVAGAEHLKRSTYMAAPLVSPTQPLTHSAVAIIGWQPPWGRMGAEGLLAMVSSVINVSPLKLFLYATASLQLTWVALAWLALRTFYGAPSSRYIAAALVCLQSVFVFFFSNSNLPNLLGALAGATLIVATQRALTIAAGAGRGAALLLVTLSFHGLLCVYPEMVPFVLLSAGLLWLRAWFAAGPRAAARPCLLVAAAVILGALLNAATTLRAWHGFMASFAAARADTSWANLFNPLILPEYLPALASLSVPAARSLGHWLGWPLTLAFALAIGLMFRGARDRLGLAAVFAGSVLLIAYTIAEDFAYGWQKSVQFAGVFFSMAFPAAALDALHRARNGSVHWQRLVTVALAGIALYLGYATAMEIREGYKWSNRKVISADWFKLRSHVGEHLRGRPVLIEPATFRMAFFHGMWAAYFLRDGHIYYAARGDENGGYLRFYVRTEADPEMPPPNAYLVSRPWGDGLDANSPRILTGREYMLLQKSNRVLALRGFQPGNGMPDFAGGSIHLEILPHSPGNLLMELTPRGDGPAPHLVWKAGRTAGTDSFTTSVSGPPPWRIRIPLAALQQNQVDLVAESVDGTPLPAQYLVRGLRIEDSP